MYNILVDLLFVNEGINIYLSFNNHDKVGLKKDSWNGNWMQLYQRVGTSWVPDTGETFWPFRPKTYLSYFGQNTQNIIIKFSIHTMLYISKFIKTYNFIGNSRIWLWCDGNYYHLTYTYRFMKYLHCSKTKFF